MENLFLLIKRFGRLILYYDLTANQNNYKKLLTYIDSLFFLKQDNYVEYKSARNMFCLGENDDQQMSSIEHKIIILLGGHYLIKELNTTDYPAIPIADLPINLGIDSLEILTTRLREIGVEFNGEHAFISLRHQIF